ncbi:hypothetical protein CR513_13776, partial [Mucuna pruriens]
MSNNNLLDKVVEEIGEELCNIGKKKVQKLLSDSNKFYLKPYMDCKSHKKDTLEVEKLSNLVLLELATQFFQLQAHVQQK